MPIDSNIILGIRPPQVQVNDPLETYTRGMQLKSLLGQQQLQGLHIEQATRANDADRKLRDLFSGMQPGQDVSEVLPQVYGIDPSTGMKLQKSILEQQKTQAELSKTRLEAEAKAMDLHRQQLGDVTTPQAAAEWVKAGYADPVLGPLAKRYGGPVETALGRIPQDPQAFEQWRQQNSMGLEKLLAHRESARRNDIAEQHNEVLKRGQNMTDTRQRELNGIMEGQSAAPSDALIDSIGKGDIELRPPPMNARNPVMMQRYDEALARVKAKYPDFAQEMYPTIKKTVASFAAGPDAKTIQSLSNATGHLDTYQRLALAMKNGDNQTINSIVNRVREQFGSSAPTNPQAVSQFLAGEIVKAASGAAGGVSDREHMASIFANKASPEQMVGAADTVREIMGQQFRSLEQKYKAGTYGRRADFADQYLTLPEVRAAYDRANKVHQTMEDAKKNQAAAAGKPAAAPTRIANDADFDKLPSGAVFIGPDGKTRRKP